MAKSNSTPCRFAYKYVKGRRVIDKRHRCSRVCSWDAADSKAWLDSTPYPTQERPPVQIEHIPCECGHTYNEHWISVAGDDGSIKALKFQSCAYYETPSSWPKRHLLTCDCLECVSARITADRREKVSA